MERLDDPGQSDDGLMAASAAGNRAAFARLVERHMAMAWRLALRLTGDAGDAEDLVQEGFARLWNQGPRWQSGQSGVAAFLTRVITNLAIDRSRRKRPQPMADLPDDPDPAPLADALLAEADTARAIQMCVAALPERQRAAIVLTYWEGLTGPMAAQTLDLSPKAFESLLIRARTALKGVMAAAGLSAADLPGDCP
jgi:RNA polymerase sigma-70 factor (ECF subfamily)